MSITAEPSFTDISEVYLSELRRGNRVSLESLAKRFPQYAERILNELPAMELLDSALRGSSGNAENSLPTIPGYTLIEELGQGASGTVYRAKDARSGRLVAIKLLRPFSHPSDLLRFEREIESLSRVQHPRIVKILSYGTAEDKPLLRPAVCPSAADHPSRHQAL